MKVWQLIVSLIYAIFLINNANSVGENGERPKLNKTFDEIFGKGWDEEVPEFTETEWHKMETQTTEVENKSTDQPNPNEQSFFDHFEGFANRKIKERFDEMFDENWSEDENNSAPSPDDLDQDNSLSDQNNSTDQDESVDEQQNDSNKSEKIKTDQQKREIIQKFREMKNNYREKNKRAHSSKEWVQIETKISNGLGVSRATIYKWSNELGLSRETKSKSKFSELEKHQILKQFDEIKSKCKKATLKNISMRELDDKIAKELFVSAATIYVWKRKFGLSVNYKKFSDFEKRKILKQFDQIKSKCKKAILQNISKNELDDKIAKELFVSAATIYAWKRKFGLSVNYKKFSDFEKLKILKQFDEIKSKCKKAKLKNISMRELDNKIAKELFVSAATIYVWKRKFGLSVSNKKFSEFEKRQILKQFDQIKGKCKQAKLKGSSKHELDETIAKKLAVCRNTIYYWKLKISSASLYKWKKQFNEGKKHF